MCRRKRKDILTSVGPAGDKKRNNVERQPNSTPGLYWSKADYFSVSHMASPSLYRLGSRQNTQRSILQPEHLVCLPLHCKNTYIQTFFCACRHACMCDCGMMFGYVTLDGVYIVVLYKIHMWLSWKLFS